jgi:hypothetical protein
MGKRGRYRIKQMGLRLFRQYLCQAEKEAAAAGEEFVLRNWSYYALKEKIQYKANKAGIMLIME